MQVIIKRLWTTLAFKFIVIIFSLLNLSFLHRFLLWFFLSILLRFFLFRITTITWTRLRRKNITIKNVFKFTKSLCFLCFSLLYYPFSLLFAYCNCRFNRFLLFRFRWFFPINNFICLWHIGSLQLPFFPHFSQQLSPFSVCSFSSIQTINIDT